MKCDACKKELGDVEIQLVFRHNKDRMTKFWYLCSITCLKELIKMYEV